MDFSLPSSKFSIIFGFRWKEAALSRKRLSWADTKQELRGQMSEVGCQKSDVRFFCFLCSVFCFLYSVLVENNERFGV